MISDSKTSALILAAGNSSRMRTQKALLRFEDENTFLENTIETYIRFGVEQLGVVVSPLLAQQIPTKIKSALRHPNVLLIINESPEKGRFSSIKLGLSALKDCDYCFLQNIDNPFIDQYLLNIIYEYKNKGGYTVPYFNDKGGHPILISNKIITYIKRTPDHNINLRHLLTLFQKVIVNTGDHKILANINSPLDYKYYFQTVKLT